MKTNDALAIVATLAGHDPATQQDFARELANRTAARAVYRLRTRLRLTQTALARRAGISRTTVAQVEAADYDGHLLALLNRIGSAVAHQVELRMPRSNVAMTV